MLIEIYALMFVAAVTFTAISWAQRELWDMKNVLFPFFASFIFLGLAIGSGNVQYDHCKAPTDYINNSDSNISKYYYSPGQANGSVRYDSPFACTTVDVEQTPMIYFNGAFGLFMLVYAIILLLDLHLNADYIAGAGQEEIQKQEGR